LYRRAAFVTVSLDDPRDYYRDVFRQFDSLTPNERSDVRALASFAQRVKSMTVAQRKAAALSQGACEQAELSVIGPAVDDPYATWAEMLGRWAGEFLTFAQMSASRETRRKLNV
jgi:hypothetical protein